MSDAAKVYFKDGEWWCDYIGYNGIQHHYLASYCLGNIGAWLQEKDAEIERLTRERDEREEAARKCYRSLLSECDIRLHRYELFGEEWPWLKESEGEG